MKRAYTVVKQIRNLELELDDYSYDEIRKAIEKLEKDNGGLAPSVLLDVIYTGTFAMEGEDN